MNNAIEEYYDLLKRIEIFSDLDGAEIDIVSQFLKKERYNRGEIIFKEGSERKNLYIVIKGNIELSQLNSGSSNKILTYFKEGSFFGEISLIDDTPHSTNALVYEDSLILVLTKDAFNSILLQYNNIAAKILVKIARVITRRIRLANTRVTNATGQYQSGKKREEHDLLGTKEVPFEHYYGIQTLRAVENFNITGVTLNFYPALIKSLAIVKYAAAKANFDLGLFEKNKADAIFKACQEVIDGKLHSHFVVDMIQGGAGTSTNMNANEVLANRALEIFGATKGDYDIIHPNNHLNLSQSTNDVYPTSIKIAIYYENKKLINVLKDLIQAFRNKAVEFSNILKIGRTQLQDAVPMTLGQEFEAYAVTLEEEIARLSENADLFLEVNMGATAIGTGINTDPEYAGLCIKYLKELSGLDVKLASNLVEATQDTGSFVMYSSAVKRLAIKLSKISNDLRLLSSGPRAGFNEINLPPMQPGSSIMPGKVNPVIPEVVNQISFKVIGNDLTVTLAAEGGQLQLNVFEPVIVQSIFESVEMLKNGMETLRTKCIQGITANEDRCNYYVENSISLVTALNPYLGYEKSSKLAKQALAENKSVYELVIENKLLSEEKLKEILRPENMVKPIKFK